MKTISILTFFLAIDSMILIGCISKDSKLKSVTGYSDTVAQKKNLAILLEQEPKTAFEYNKRGIERAKLSDFKGALEDFDNALRDDSLNVSYLLNMVHVNSDLKNYKAMIPDCSKAIGINSKNPLGYSGRGEARYNLLDYAGAIEDYNKAIELTTLPVHGLNLAATYFGLGAAKFAMGQNHDACIEWKKSDELGYKDAKEILNKYCKIVSIGIGETGKTDYFDITVNRVRIGKTVGNYYYPARAGEGNIFLVIMATFTNIDTESRLTLPGFVPVHFNGKDYKFDSPEVLSSDFMEQLNPLVKKEVKIVYKLPENISGDLYWTPGRNSGILSFYLGNRNLLQIKN